MENLKITPKQLQILLLLYRFRFLDRTQIQRFLNHKDPKRINIWLKDLTNKNIMKEKLIPFQFLSIEEAIKNSQVAFSIADLEKVYEQPMETKGKTLEELLPTISSESLAKQLIQSEVYSNISIAWEDVCRMRRIKKRMQESYIKVPDPIPE